MESTVSTITMICAQRTLVQKHHDTEDFVRVQQPVAQHIVSEAAMIAIAISTIVPITIHSTTIFLWIYLEEEDVFLYLLMHLSKKTGMMYLI